MMGTIYQEKNNSVYIHIRLYKMNTVLNTERPEWVYGTCVVIGYHCTCPAFPRYL